jgi:hypothetical protein
MNVFYTNRFIPARFAAYRADAGLLAHERVHVRQWLRTLMLHPLLYSLSDRYKLRCETEAYQAQAGHYPDDRMPVFAQYLARDYGLSITEAEALARLRGDK